MGIVVGIVVGIVYVAIVGNCLFRCIDISIYRYIEIIHYARGRLSDNIQIYQIVGSLYIIA